MFFQFVFDDKTMSINISIKYFKDKQDIYLKRGNMIRWPYRFRKPEGVKKGIIGFRTLWYKWDMFAENLFVRYAKLPKVGIYRGEPRTEKIIVSLTSFPARIDKVYFAVKSLMIQSLKADEIILWLAKEQFPEQKLPKKFEKLIQRGLTIKWCDDKRSHKKYYYALQEQKPNELVLTYDDDIIYEYNSIEKLIDTHNIYPNCIICNRGHQIVRDENGVMLPYIQWKISSQEGVDNPSMEIMPSTGAGCLYPYGSMPDITFNWEIIQKNAITADDIWMRFCSYSNKVKIKRTAEQNATLCIVYGSQKERLTYINDICGENQQVIENLAVIFPEVYRIS